MGSPAPLAAKMLRHLEYSFNQSAPAGGGTMSVDILSVDPDGGLVVRISERDRSDAAPRQAFTCKVYGNTTVVCPATATPSQAESVLLAFLGRQFIDAAPWDPQGHWQRSEQSQQADTQEDFTLMDAGDGKKVVVREVKKMQAHTGGAQSQTSEITINYDRAMEVPDTVRDDVATSGGNAASHASYQFTLQADSFAKPAPP